MPGRGAAHNRWARKAARDGEASALGQIVSASAAMANRIGRV